MPTASRAVCGGTRVTPASNAPSIFFFHPSRIAYGLWYIFSRFTMAGTFAERGKRLANSRNWPAAGVATIASARTGSPPNDQT